MILLGDMFCQGWLKISREEHERGVSSEPIEPQVWKGLWQVHQGVLGLNVSHHYHLEIWSLGFCEPLEEVLSPQLLSKHWHFHSRMVMMGIVLQSWVRVPIHQESIVCLLFLRFWGSRVVVLAIYLAPNITIPC